MGKVTKDIIKTAKIIVNKPTKSTLETIKFWLKLNFAMNIGIYAYLLEIHKLKYIKLALELLGIIF